jgi:hypothetical protein
MVHLGFVAFVIAGGALCWRWPRLAWLHLPAAAWGVWIELSGRVCPLTPLEVRLRLAAGEAGYEGGFVEHYLIPLLYPDGLERDLQLWLGIAVISVNFFVYLALILHRWQR